MPCLCLHLISIYKCTPCFQLTWSHSFHWRIICLISLYDSIRLWVSSSDFVQFLIQIPLRMYMSCSLPHFGPPIYTAMCISVCSLPCFWSYMHKHIHVFGSVYITILYYIYMSCSLPCFGPPYIATYISLCLTSFWSYEHT